MNTTNVQIAKILERLEINEKLLQEIIKNTSKVRGKSKKKVNLKDECTIHLSFAGLNRMYEEKKIE